MPAALLQKETRDFIDAGLLINSPYFSVLRKKRNIDLIIALDFSDGDPFTVCAYLIQYNAHIVSKEVNLKEYIP